MLYICNYNVEQMQYKLRPYQEKCVQKGIESLTSSKPTKSVLVAPTGTGKSLIIGSITKELDDYVLVLQPSKELLLQNYEKYTSYGLEASVYSASLKRRELDKKVIFATPKSILKDIDVLRANGLKYIIVDEANRGSAKGSVLDKIISASGVKNVLGLTATPVVITTSRNGSMLKMMNRDYNNIFNSICHIVQIAEIKKRFWSKIEYRQEETDLDGLELNSSGTEFTEKSIINVYKENDFNSIIKENVEKLENENVKSILIFCPSVNEAIELSGIIKGSKVVYGDLDATERDSTLNSFKQGEFNVLINCQMLQIGYDNPNIEAIIMASPTNSVALFYQIVGRIVRIKEGKEKAIVLDLVGNTERFGKIEDFTFENQEYTKGWAMFSGDKILTNFPLGSKVMPTRTLAIKFNKSDDINGDYKFIFGKHKGKTLKHVYNKDASYIKWLINNKDFDWKSGSNKRLKDSLEQMLKIEI